MSIWGEWLSLVCWVFQVLSTVPPHFLARFHQHVVVFDIWVWHVFLYLHLRGFLAVINGSVTFRCSCLWYRDAVTFVCFSSLVELAKCPVHSAGFSVDSQSSSTETAVLCGNGLVGWLPFWSGCRPACPALLWWWHRAEHESDPGSCLLSSQWDSTWVFLVK